MTDLYAHMYSIDPDADSKESVDDGFDVAAEIARADAEAAGLPNDFEDI